MADATYLTDHLLIAMPAMGDPNFARTVTYICQHNADGAMGLIVNRPAGFSLGDILAELSLEAANAQVAQTPILIGGPVQPERGFVLHAPDERSWDSSFQVAPDMAVTTSRDILLAIAEGRAPARTLFALGYAGWGAGQLDRELLDNAWLTAPAERSILFDTPIERRWQAAAFLVGVDPSNLPGYAGHA